MSYTCETCGKVPARCGSGSCDGCIIKHSEVLEAEYEHREWMREVERKMMVAELQYLENRAVIEEAKKEKEGEIL